MTAELKILCLKGPAIKPYISELAKLRIEVFKSYPYLYAGDIDYEARYLQTYVRCEESIMVLAFDQNNVIGASTAIPLKDETDYVQKTFLDHHMNLDEIFYLGESVLLPEYRGQNVYRHFFQERETAAKAYGCKITTFAAVERSPTDPRRPKDFIPLDNVWKHFGYHKSQTLCANFEWLEIGETAPSPKPLFFWLKNL